MRVGAGRAAGEGPNWPLRWLVIILVALAARAATFGDPIVHVDEEFYLTVARRMWRGDLLYVDVWDRKPIGLFLLYMPVAWLPPRVAVLGYQLLATGFVVLTAGLAAALADRAGWRRGALIGALLYVLWLDLADGQGGQAPVFYDLFTAAAAWAAMRAGEADAAGRLRLGTGAMLLVGAALQVKYSVLFEGLFFGLWLLWAEWRASRSLAALVGRGAVWAAAALAPTALAWGWYAAIGQGDAFLYANFLSILHRRSDPADELRRNAITCVQLLAPLVLLAVVGVRLGAGRAGRRRLLLYGWLAAAIGGLAVFGSWFNHYTLPVMLPAAVGAAGAFARWRGLRLAAVPALIVAFAAGQRVTLSERTHRGSAAEFAAVARAVGRGPGSLYVYSASPMLYAFSDRPSLTPYLMPAHLLLTRETGAIGVDQRAEVARVLARRPAVIVMQSWDDFERPDLRPMVLAALQRGGYARVAVLPVGRNTVSVFRAP